MPIKLRNTIKKTEKTIVKPSRKNSVYDEIKSISSMNFESSYIKEDSVKFDNVNGELVFRFVNAKTLSHNKILRVKDVTLSKYKKSWYSRINSLANKNRETINKFIEINPGLLSIEGVEVRRTSERDLDSSMASMKPLIDGFVKAGVFKDDSQKYIIPLPFLQKKGNHDDIVIVVRSAPKLERFMSKEVINFIGG